MVASKYSRRVLGLAESRSCEFLNLSREKEMMAYQCGVRRKSLDGQVVADELFVGRLLLIEIKSDECFIEPFVGCFFAHVDRFHQGPKMSRIRIIRHTLLPVTLFMKRSAYRSTYRPIQVCKRDGNIRVLVKSKRSGHKLLILGRVLATYDPRSWRLK